MKMERILKKEIKINNIEERKKEWEKIENNKRLCSEYFEPIYSYPMILCLFLNKYKEKHKNYYIILQNIKK